MSVARSPEPELTDLPHEAEAYAAADFGAVNAAYVARLAELAGGLPPTARAVDLGCGPGDITRRIAAAFPEWRIVGVDGAAAMLELAEAAGPTPNVRYVRADAKGSGLPAGSFDVVCSNSILHHVADAGAFWREVRRLAAPGALLFHRDLFRPAEAAAVDRLVALHVGGESPTLREEFRRSLFAAYTPEEALAQLAEAGLAGMQVATVTDRHFDVWGRLPA